MLTVALHGPLAVAAAVAVVRLVHALVLVVHASRERRQILARVLGGRRTGVVVEHHGCDGARLTVRSGGPASRGGRS